MGFVRRFIVFGHGVVVWRESSDFFNKKGIYIQQVIFKLNSIRRKKKKKVFLFFI